MTDPREAEATGRTATVNFRGETFTFPVEYADYPLSFIEAVSDGRAAAIQSRELLGPEQWAKVRGMGLHGRDLEALTDALNEAMGTDEGEDTASSA